MSWKKSLQLRDLHGDQSLEITCRTCGYTRYEMPSALLQDDDLRHAYLDEVEAALFCKARDCTGPVRIALTGDAETEGFMGGLP